MATLLQDTFTDADSTALTSHTPTVGSGWSYLSGTFSINSNTVVMPNSDGESIAVMDAGVSDYVVSLVINFADSIAYYNAIVFRASDINNYWFASLERSGGVPFLRIAEIASGAFTSRGTVTLTGFPGGPLAVTLTLTVSGTSASLAESTGTIGSPLVYGSMASNLTATKVGIDNYYNAGSSIVAPMSFDNFLVTGTPPSSGVIPVIVNQYRQRRS